MTQQLWEGDGERVKYVHSDEEKIQRSVKHVHFNEVNPVIKGALVPKE